LSITAIGKIIPKKISFTKEPGGEVDYFTPTRIKEFGVAGEIFTSAVVEVDTSFYDLAYLTYSEEFSYRTDTAFLQLLASGEIPLYRYSDPKGKENFLVRNDSGYHLLHFKEYLKNVNGAKTVATNNKFRGELIFFLRDCPSLQNTISSIGYNESDLSRVFREYNKCKNKEDGYVKKAKNFKADFGILAGLSVTNLSFDGDHYYYHEILDAELSSSTNFTFGLFFDWQLPKLRNKWSINNELLFTSFSIEDQYTKESQIESGYNIYDINIGYSYLKINNMARYRFPAGKDFSVFINAGISNACALKEKNYMKTTSVYSLGSTEITEELEGKAVSLTTRYELGLTAGLGCRLKNLSFEARYERGGGMSDHAQLSSPTGRIYFLLGYMF